MFGASYRTSAITIFSQTTNNVSRANLLVAHRIMHSDIMGRPGDLKVAFVDQETVSVQHCC